MTAIVLVLGAAAATWWFKVRPAGTPPEAASADAGRDAAAVPQPRLTTGDERAAAADMVCSRDGWCWEWPRPLGMDLNAVWASPEGAWAVGAAGTILARAERAWQFDAPKGRQRWVSVWGRSPKDVWVLAASGEIAHRQPSGWTTVTRVRELAERDAHSERGKVTFTSLWVSEKGRVWAVGGIRDDAVLGKDDDDNDRSSVAYLAYSDGADWRLERFDDAYPLADVFGKSDRDVWSCARRGPCFHWTGGSFVRGKPPYSVASARRGNEAAGREWEIPTRLPAGSSPADDGALHRIRNVNRPAGDPANASQRPVRDFFAVASSDVWAVGERGVLTHWNGRAWSETPERPLGSDRVSIADLSCGPPEKSKTVWAVGAEDGLTWQRGFALAWNEGWRLLIGSRSFEPDIPANGAAQPSAEAFWRVVAGHDDDRWIGGEHGVLFHSSRGAPKRVSTPSAEKPAIRDIVILPNGELWLALGSSILRGNGQEWTAVDVEPGRFFHALAGTSSEDIWAHAPATDTSARVPSLLHWNGTRWSTPFSVLEEEDALGAQREVRRLAASPDGAVWLTAATRVARVTKSGHLESMLAIEQTPNLRDHVRGLWTAPEGDVWVAGDGRVQEWQADRGWREESLPGGPPLNAICGTSDELWAAGDGAILRKRRHRGTASSRAIDGGGK